MKKKRKKAKGGAPEYSGSHQLVSKKKLTELVIGAIISWALPSIMPVVIYILSDIWSTRIIVSISIITIIVWAIAFSTVVRALLVMVFHIHDDMRKIISLLSNKIGLDIRVVDNMSRVLDQGSKILRILEKKKGKRRR